MKKKNLYRWHKWSGVTLGVFLFLIAVSGVGITFRQELLPKFYSSLFMIEEQNEILPLHELYEGLQSHLKPNMKISNVYGSESPDEAYLFLYKTEGDKFPTMITVNPYTGAIVGEMSMIQNFFALMLFMHANLFLGKTGSYFVGFLGLVLIFFIVSGLIIWLPENKLALKIKRTFSFEKTRKAQKLHHILGLTLAIPLFISALTGFLTVFDLSYSVSRPLLDQAPRVEELERPQSCTFDQELAVLKSLDPEMEENLISVHFCSPKSGLMKISYGLHDRDFLNGYGRIVIDPQNLNRLQEFNSEKDPSSWNFKRLLIFPIHSGEYWGFFGKTINFFTGLGLMIIFCSGLFLFFKRRS